jgi:hypothetical protein
MERTWFRTQSREWRTLAIVPTEIESSEAAFSMAKLIIELGAEHDEKLNLADFRNIPLSRLSPLLQMAASYVKDGQRLVYATQPIDENPATVPVARAADCVLLCVSLGKTSIRKIEDAIDQIGRERFLGSVVFRHTRSKKPTRETGIVVRNETAEMRR